MVSRQTEKLLKLIEKARPRDPVSRKIRLRPKRKRIQIPKSTEQKREEKKVRRMAREDYLDSLETSRAQVVELARGLQRAHPGHKLSYYMDDLTQRRAPKSRRALTLWNCFVHAELKKINDALPDDAPRVKSSNKEVSNELKASWKTLNETHTKEEIQELLKESFDYLTALREERIHGVHVHQISAFHDVRASILSVEQQLNDLKARTGYETILVGARSSQDAYATPVVFVSSDTGLHFLQSQLKAGAGADTGIVFEGYLAQGLQATIETRLKSLVQLKKDTVNLISQKLDECIGGKVKRLNYADFDNKMTRVYGVRIIGWPLKQFCSPGDISIMNDLQVLYNSWESGMTRWVKLSEAEYSEWVAAHPVQASSENTPTSVPSSTPPPTLLTPLNPNIDPRLLNLNQPQSSQVSSNEPTPAGSGSVASKKQRKQRSDKGKKRGPRRSNGTENIAP